MSENNNSEKFNPTTYKNKFQKEKYDRIIVNVPKGDKVSLLGYAALFQYKSLNDLFVKATEEKIKRDIETIPPETQIAFGIDEANIGNVEAILNQCTVKGKEIESKRKQK